MTQISRLVKAYEQYGKSEFKSKCDAILNEIQEKFEQYGFIEKYLQCEEKPAIFYSYVVCMLTRLPDEELIMLNEMHKMLSTANCWHVLYSIGEVIHNVVVELLVNAR